MRYSLHITNNCNLRCTYCYEDNKIDRQRKQFVISFEEIDEKINEILAHGNCDELELLGGEIFLYMDKVSYLIEKYHNKFAIIITTNGTIRNAEIDELIAKYRLGIGVSLDDPQTISKQRIGIDFERVLANAKHWNTLTNVAITAVITPLNIRRIKETFDFYVLEQGFRTIHFGCVEEWLNDYYWEIYKKEVLRLIQATDLKILQQVTISPWKYHVPSHKKIIIEDGIEKMEIFDNNQIELCSYRKAIYACYVAYCEKLGKKPEPMIPEGVQVVTRGS
ncbi:radical SAM/SPASM domain-containing protein [Candidatus Termititenax aidoneus]|uniref:Radical SAM/SPASM domain-containing protein n=1 Tax=Termititenax aidoneus TaxID=2218524 RepID=A0A388TC75_TERA1|nr:radical SAM/SPASM domain-containing protein [Candidatus Termititenax aidoneus]